MRNDFRVFYSTSEREEIAALQMKVEGWESFLLDSIAPYKIWEREKGDESIHSKVPGTFVVPFLSLLIY